MALAAFEAGDSGPDAGAARRAAENTIAVRRQIVRDLHDGAQQRLINILISLQLARETMDTDREGAGALCDDAILRAQEAINELRQLVAGVRPSTLTLRGLVAAVEELAARSVLPVVVTGALGERLSEVVESNAYFVTAEALTNTVKHARATRAEIDIEIVGRTLVIEVTDDGVGGADDCVSGTGLAGLADRVHSLGGRVEVVSPVGRGTTVRAMLPVRGV